MRSLFAVVVLSVAALTAACGVTPLLPSGAGAGGVSDSGGTSGLGGSGAGGGPGGISNLGGSGSAGGINGPGGSSGVGSTVVGGSGGSSLPLTGNCANLTCLNPLLDLMKNCQPGGTCTEQVTLTGAANMCYSNGVKMQATLDMATMSSMMVTVKNGGTLCYTMMVSGISSASSMTIAIKNASGTLVGTIATDSASNETLTCPGGTPTVIDASCGTTPNSAAIASTASSCTQGLCTF